MLKQCADISTHARENILVKYPLSTDQEMQNGYALFRTASFVLCVTLSDCQVAVQHSTAHDYSFCQPDLFQPLPA